MLADVVAQTPAVLHRGTKPDDTTLLDTNTDQGPLVSYLKGTIEGIKLPILIDSGSCVSLMSSDFRMSIPALSSRPLKKDYIVAHAINGQMLDTLGTLTVTLQLGIEIWPYVFHIVRETMQFVLLGWDFLVKNHALLHISHAKLHLWDISIPLLTSSDFVPTCCNVSLATDMTLPPLSEPIVPVKIPYP